MKHKGLRLGALFCAAAMTITTSAQALSVEEAYDILRRSYVDRLPRAAKDAESLDELFSYTDNYTCYMTEEEYQTFLSSVEGEVSFAGIGAEITYAPEGISIVSVLKGGGAEKAGLKAGDMIIAIEGALLPFSSNLIFLFFDIGPTPYLKVVVLSHGAYSMYLLHSYLIL